MVSPRDPGPAEVAGSIKAEQIPPVWIWSGPERFLKDELIVDLVQRILPGGKESLNLNRYRAGGDTGIEDIVAMCRSLPMFGGQEEGREHLPTRVVYLQDIDALNKGDRERLAEYVASPTRETALVLTSERGPQDSLVARLAKTGGALAVFWIPFERDAVEWIRKRFGKAGKSCSPSIARDLLHLCAMSEGTKVPLAEVAAEVDKILLALGDRPAPTDADLETIGRKADESLVKEIAGRVTTGDLPGALRALDGALLFKTTTAPYIVALLTGRIRTLAHVRDLLDAGLSVNDAKRTANVWESEWPVLQAGLKRYDGRHLRRSLTVLAEADRTLKSSARNPRVVLETTLATLCNTAG